MLLSSRKYLFAALLLAVSCMAGAATERIELEDIQIRGVQELPKVQYIVPWKKIAPDTDQLPLKSMIDEVLAPVDIDIFRRQVRYYDVRHAAGDARTQD